MVTVTPNNLHIPIEKEFLRRGIHVIYDKPLAAHYKKIKSFTSLVKRSDDFFSIRKTTLSLNYIPLKLKKYIKQIISYNSNI